MFEQHSLSIDDDYTTMDISFGPQGGQTVYLASDADDRAVATDIGGALRFNFSDPSSPWAFFMQTGVGYSNYRFHHPLSNVAVSLYGELAGGCFTRSLYEIPEDILQECMAASESYTFAPLMSPSLPWGEWEGDSFVFFILLLAAWGEMPGEDLQRRAD